MNLDFIKTNMLVLTITIVLGYILGMSVIKTVDNRLSSISINMPKINVPAQKMYVTTDEKNNILLSQNNGDIVEGYTIKDLKDLEKIENLKQDDEDNCLDVYNSWGKSSNQDLVKKYPKCFLPNEKDKRIKKMNGALNILKKISRNDICDRVRSRADKINNPEARKLAKKMFAPCYSEDEDIAENFQSYSRLDGKDECDVHTKAPRKPLKQEKLEQYKKALGLDSEPSQDAGMLPRMTQEEKDEDEKMEKELMKLKDEVKSDEGNSRVCEKDADCNEFYGDGENICKSNGRCHCIKGSGSLCQHGPTNYMDPKDMTKEQRNRFENMEDLTKMTVQDYINWLRLFKNKPNDLSESHFINYQKLKRGDNLRVIDIPKANITPPRKVHSYFAKLWETGYAYGVNEDRMKDRILSYNYSDYEEYIPPKKLKDVKILNPDLIYKRDPVAVNNFLMPRDSSVETEKLIRESRALG